MKVTTVDIESMFRRLIADVSCLASVPVALPDRNNFDCMKWGLIEGPQLDKALLSDIENSTHLAQALCPLWLKPLYAAFITEQFGGESRNRGLMLRYLRQLCLFVYKAKLPYEETVKQSTIDSFCNTDRSLDDTWSYRGKNSPGGHLDLILRRARRRVQRVIANIDWTAITPSHGPGAVFPPRTAMRKSRWLSYYSAIAAKYPYGEYFFLPEEAYHKDTYSQLRDVNVCRAKLTCVPKDARGPRLICIHPAEAIWIQQGQRKLLESAIERHIKTVRFRDQTLNQEQAYRSSLTGAMVTLDLKEASDRISTNLVNYLFGEYATEWLCCARAKEVLLPSGEVHRLRKFAPMGNCLTFPVQTLIFHSLIMAVMSHSRIPGECYVFGDDCIFPKAAYELVHELFENVGLRINVQKTFRNGLFRESCGIDAYSGVLVTPLRLKEVDTSYLGLVSLCDLAKRLRLAGYEETAAAAYAEVRKHSSVPIALTNDSDANGLVEFSTERNVGVLLCQRTVRFNVHTHQHEVRSHKVVPAAMRGTIDDASHLLEAIVAPNTGGRGLAARYVDVHNTSLVRTWTRIVLSDDTWGRTLPAWYSSDIRTGYEVAALTFNEDTTNW